MANKSREETLRELVNSSGFPLQFAVEHLVSRSTEEHAWKILVREHPWKHPRLKQEGFIDLVLERGNVRLVIECKRRRQAAWVFLVPDGSTPGVRRARCHWVAHFPERDFENWDDFEILPYTYESQFCVVRGQSNEQKPFLEGVAGCLATATESVGSEERGLAGRANEERTKVFAPVVVTTAQLQVCRFDPGQVSLDDGEIAGGTFESVPYIRFRKSLTTELVPESKATRRASPRLFLAASVVRTAERVAVCIPK